MQEQEEEIFDIAVNINNGLEPLTFTIIVLDDSSGPEQVLNFKVTRNKETLGIIRSDEEHGWKLLEGDLDQEQIEAIGSAIDGYYC